MGIGIDRGGGFAINPEATAKGREKSRQNLCHTCLGALDRHTIRERRECRAIAAEWDGSEQAETESVSPLE